MDKKEVSKKAGYYLDFLNKGSKEGYEFEYSNEEIIDGKNRIYLTLNIDCESYVFGELDRDEILEELNEEESYVSFGFDTQGVFIKIVNKDKFFNKYIIQLKEYIKKSIYGNSIQSVNFYRRKGSEIYPPEVSISIKSDIKISSHEWFDSCVHITSLLQRYSHEKGFRQLVEMQFLADVHLVCESCKGKRFKDEILEVHYREKSIYDVLQMSVDDALEFFKDIKEIKNKIQPLQDVGLGYVKLGQSSNTLSGGEAQRVKLASFLGKGKSAGKILFIFDEPTTGLHFNDINKLLASFRALIKQGHSVIVIEHNTDVIRCADWVIDLGPEAGDNGGTLVYAGIPSGLKNIPESYTGQYL